MFLSHRFLLYSPATGREENMEYLCPEVVLEHLTRKYLSYSNINLFVTLIATPVRSRNHEHSLIYPELQYHSSTPVNSLGLVTFGLLCSCTST